MHNSQAASDFQQTRWATAGSWPSLSSSLGQQTARAWRGSRRLMVVGVLSLITLQPHDNKSVFIVRATPWFTGR